MLVKVTLGEPMCNDVGARDAEVEFPGEASDATVTLGELAGRLGVKLADSEGALLVMVNGEVVPPAKANTFRLHGGDHVDLHMILAGG
jgi:sulfur carrier protein ThiS